MSVAITLVAITIVLDAVLWGVISSGAHGGLESNPWAGIRTPATMASPEAWRAGHQEGLRYLRWFLPVNTVVALVAAAVAWVVGEDDGRAMIPFGVWFAVFLAGSLGIAAVAGRAARKATMESR